MNRNQEYQPNYLIETLKGAYTHKAIQGIGTAVCLLIVVGVFSWIKDTDWFLEQWGALANGITIVLLVAVSYFLITLTREVLRYFQIVHHINKQDVRVHCGKVSKTYGDVHTFANVTGGMNGDTLGVVLKEGTHCLVLSFDSLFAEHHYVLRTGVHHE